MHPSISSSFTPVQLQVSSSLRSCGSCGKLWRASCFVVVDRPNLQLFVPSSGRAAARARGRRPWSWGCPAPASSCSAKPSTASPKSVRWQRMLRAPRLATLAHRARAPRLHQPLSSFIHRGAGSEVLVEAIAGDAVRAPCPRCTTRRSCAASARCRCAVALMRADVRGAARCRSLSCAPSTRRARRIWPCVCAPTASTPSACATWCRPPSTPRQAGLPFARPAFHA